MFGKEGFFETFHCTNSHCKGNGGSPWTGTAVLGSLGHNECPVCGSDAVSDGDIRKIQDKLARPLVAV